MEKQDEVCKLGNDLNKYIAERGFSRRTACSALFGLAVSYLVESKVNKRDFLHNLEDMWEHYTKLEEQGKLHCDD